MKQFFRVLFFYLVICGCTKSSAGDQSLVPLNSPKKSNKIDKQQFSRQLPPLDIAENSENQINQLVGRPRRDTPSPYELFMPLSSSFSAPSIKVLAHAITPRTLQRISEEHKSPESSPSSPSSLRKSQEDLFHRLLDIPKQRSVKIRPSESSPTQINLDELEDDYSRLFLLRKVLLNNPKAKPGCEFFHLVSAMEINMKVESEIIGAHKKLEELAFDNVKNAMSPKVSSPFGRLKLPFMKKRSEAKKNT